MIRDEEEQERYLYEVAQWLETWTENNAIPGTMPGDESPCIDAVDFRKACVVEARGNGYSEDDLLNVKFVEGNLDMYFDRAARRNYRINPGR